MPKFDFNKVAEVFLGKGVLRICSKFTGEHQCQSVISIKLRSNFIEITLRDGFSPVNLLHIFRTFFLRTPVDGCFCTSTSYHYLSYCATVIYSQVSKCYKFLTKLHIPNKTMILPYLWYKTSPSFSPSSIFINSSVSLGPIWKEKMILLN